MDIKIRGLSEAVVLKIDEKTKKFGYKSRNDFLKDFFEREFLLGDKIKEHDNQYNLLIQKILKQLEYNSKVLNKFCLDNLISLDEIIKNEIKENMEE